MNMRALLVATSILASGPELAAIDPPAASKADGRMRTVAYDPNNPVELHTQPGLALRVVLGAGEEVVQVITSDQEILAPDPTEPALPATQVSNGLMPGQGGEAAKMPPSCDRDLCRSVWGNIVYLKPIRPLSAQPLFVQTRRTDAAGHVEMVPYSFVLSASVPSPADKVQAQPVWGVQMVYPARIKAQQVAAWLARKREDEAKQAQLASIAQPSPVFPCDTLKGVNWQYGYVGSAALKPDAVCDDGRTTYLRYNGNRRVPNVYEKIPGQKGPALPVTSTDPDPTGNTLRITSTGKKWFLWNGDDAGCLLNDGADPTGSTATTIATAQVAGQ